MLLRVLLAPRKMAKFAKIDCELQTRNSHISLGIPCALRTYAKACCCCCCCCSRPSHRFAKHMECLRIYANCEFVIRNQFWRILPFCEQRAKLATTLIWISGSMVVSLYSSAPYKEQMLYKWLLFILVLLFIQDKEQLLFILIKSIFLFILIRSIT